MKTRIAGKVLSLVIGGTVLLGGAEKASAQFGIRLPQFRTQQRKTDLRHSYRPRIKVVRSSNSRNLKAGTALAYEFYAKKGYVSRIEVRSGYKVIKTINVSGARSGRGTVVLRTSQLSGAFGRPVFKLWAWQGKPSYQSLHGESIGYTLVD